MALAAFWFLYLGALGILYPFFSLYLSANAGLTATEVGVVITMSPLIALAAPTAWGRRADRASSRARVLAWATLGAAASTALLARLCGFWPLLFGTVALALFSTGVLPLTVSVTLASLGEQALYRFGLVRVWGTVGFLVLVTALPPLLHGAQQAVGLAPVPPGSPEPGLEVMFLIAAALMLVSAGVAFALPDAGESGRGARREDWRELRRHRPFVRALLFSFAAYLFLQGPMSLFPVYLRARGGGLDALSRMWVLMLLPEIPLVALSGAGVRRIGPRGLLTAGVAAGGARWLVCGLTADRWAIYAVQCLHGVMVAGVGIGAALYVESTVPARLRATGQGLNAMAGAGVGAILSNVATGWLIDHGGAETPFVMGGSLALSLAALAPFWLPTPSRPPSGEDLSDVPP